MKFSCSAGLRSRLIQAEVRLIGLAAPKLLDDTKAPSYRIVVPLRSSATATIGEMLRAKSAVKFN